MTRKPVSSEINIDPSPVNCVAVSWLDSRIVGNEHRLVIEPNRGYFRVAWGFLALGGLGVPLVVLVNWHQPAGRGIALLIGGVLLIIGMAMLALRRRFLLDRATGELWMRPGLTSRSVPLSEIRAIQVVSGGIHETFHSAFTTHQLNLVLGRDRLERINLSNQPDLDWAVEAGALLARFLDVPLFDPTGRGARQSADLA